MKISINNRSIGLDYPPYIIAELSANHNGSLETAKKSIEIASGCGVDAIKLQTYTADTMTLDCNHEDFMIKRGPWNGYKLFDLYQWAHTPFEWHKELFDYARELGVTIFSTPFDASAVDLLEKLNAPAYKIASFEITDLPLIRYAAATGKPLIISTGMSSEGEIEEAVNAARDSGCSQMIVLHCVSSYPTPLDQANLRMIPELAKRFDVATGLSDHTLGVTAPLAAVALGAVVLEKHFTLSRASKGPDSEFSLEPSEFVQLCRETRDVWSALGSPDYSRQISEEENKLFRRSIYFVCDLPAGALIRPEDIRRIRPGFGLPPKYFDFLVGKRLKVAVTRGTATSLEQIDGP